MLTGKVPELAMAAKAARPNANATGRWMARSRKKAAKSRLSIYLPGAGSLQPRIRAAIWASEIMAMASMATGIAA